MTFFEAVREALKAVIQWISMAFMAFCDFINVSEWAVLTFTFVAIGSFISISIYRNRK